MTDALDKSCRENQKTSFMFRNFSYKNHRFCEIMWENTK